MDPEERAEILREGAVWRAIQWIDDASCDGGKIESSKVDAAIERLSNTAVQGLIPDQIDSLISTWIKLKLPLTKWIKIGCCIIPEKTISDEIVHRVLRWIRSNWNAEYLKKITFLLGWLQGLMEHNLVSIDTLDMYYEFFFYLLNFESASMHASKFVHVLTKPHDITRVRVLHILKIAKSHRQSKYYNPLFAILNLFKSFKPECVPENIPVFCINTVFPVAHKGMVENLQRAQLRRNISISLTSECRLIWWSAVSNKSNKQNMQSLIPTMEYIQLGSNLYSNNSQKKTCLEFQNEKDLLLCDLENNVDTPANILSLLINDAGLQIIMFSNDMLKSRFSHVLYQTLYNNFIEKSILSYEEKQIFLERLVLLEKYLQQGIPVVSRFLALFISNWNGRDFCNEIFSLLEWITFESFEELYDCILEHIEMLYLTNNAYYGCTIVNMLKMMYVRIHERMESNDDKLFLSRPKKYNDVDVLTNLTDFMDDLCEKSFRDIYTNPLLRDTFLDAYITIEKMQRTCSKSLWTIVPMSLSYGVLCSLNGFAIDKILGLFIRYRFIYEKIKAVEGKENIKRQIMLIQNYSMDYINCLWYGESISSSRNNLLFSRMPTAMLEHLERNVEGYNKFLLYWYHPALSPYIYSQIPLNIIKKCETLQSVTEIAPIYSNLSKFIEIIVEKS